jgi:hypothetical protein
MTRWVKIPDGHHIYGASEVYIDADSFRMIGLLDRSLEAKVNERERYHVSILRDGLGARVQDERVAFFADGESAREFFAALVGNEDNWRELR